MHVLPSKLLCYHMLHPVTLTEHQRAETMSLIKAGKGGKMVLKANVNERFVGFPQGSVR